MLRFIKKKIEFSSNITFLNKIMHYLIIIDIFSNSFIQSRHIFKSDCLERFYVFQRVHIQYAHIYMMNSVYNIYNNLELYIRMSFCLKNSTTEKIILSILKQT